MAVNPGLVTSTGAQKTEMVVDFGLTTSMVQNQAVPGTIYALGASFAGVSAQLIPLTEVWHITDIYINGAPAGPNGQILIQVNGFPQIPQPSIANTQLGLYSRFDLTQSVVLVPGATFSVSLVLGSAPTAAVTQSVYLPFMRSPYTG